MMSAVESVSRLPLPEAVLHGALAVERKLSDFESLTGRLDAGGSALHAYEIDGRAGNHVRLRVTSDAFHVVAFLVLASSRGETFTKVVPGLVPAAAGALGGPESVSGGIEAQAPVTLPADGLYRVVVTSIENQAEQRAVSSGEYRMTLLVDAPSAAPSVEPPVDSERGTRFSAWESDSR
jgi:hypothetical protein